MKQESAADAAARDAEKGDRFDLEMSPVTP
jgi:hypothetical protein